MVVTVFFLLSSPQYHHTANQSKQPLNDSKMRPTMLSKTTPDTSATSGRQHFLVPNNVGRWLVHRGQVPSLQLVERELGFADIAFADGQSDPVLTQQLHVEATHERNRKKTRNQHTAHKIQSRNWQWQWC